MRGTASVPLRYRSGLYYNAWYRLGTASTASVPLGPSVTMRGIDTPFAFCKALIWVGVKNFQENTKTNRNPQNATLTL